VRVQTTRAVTVVRRFRGPTVDQLFVLCRPGEGAADPPRQAESVYQRLLEILASEGAGAASVVRETVFLRRIREDFDAIRSARSRVLGGDGTSFVTTFIGQPPVGGNALELFAVAVVPRPGEASSSDAVRRKPTCSCDGCSAGVGARIVRLGDEAHLHAGNVYGSGRDAFEEAYDMFRVAEGLLEEAGMGFGNAIRVWIHLRDIDRDYDALNRARREFFRHRGIERRPASTGVQGIPFPGAHDFSMSFDAVSSRRPLDVAVMSTPSLGEAWRYGAEFSRGLRIAGVNEATLHISGTASIDEAGQTVHAGDFEAQADRMLHNIASLLAQQGAGFQDLVSGVTYLKNPHDATALRSIFRERGFEGFPCALVEAPLCRPELLCEAEAVAILPLKTAGA
jgi:enamine deaminase RidA (YjgF/YER057c/UK114 family)